MKQKEIIKYNLERRTDNEVKVVFDFNIYDKFDIDSLMFYIDDLIERKIITIKKNRRFSFEKNI